MTINLSIIILPSKTSQKGFPFFIPTFPQPEFVEKKNELSPSIFGKNSLFLLQYRN